MILSYNARKMQDILQSFYQLTGMRIVVFSDDFRKVAEAPGSDCAFCQLIRADGAAAQKCHASDRYGCEQCREQDSLHTYTCHAGLSETVAPIRHGNLIIGYLMFGQVLRQPNADAYWETVRGACAGYDVDMDKLYAAYKRKRPIQIEQVYAAANILEACAGYLWLERAVLLQSDSLPGQIDTYIAQNPSADLSVGALCAKFGISRSKLYKIAQEYYGCGVEQMTRALRVAKARELLDTTGEPLAEIAYRVGYPDYNYFIKVFKKEAGVTPARYRRNKGFSL